MPFEILDLILGGIMLLSACWRSPAASPARCCRSSPGAWRPRRDCSPPSTRPCRLAEDYVQSDTIAKIGVGGGVFLIVLIVLSMISVRIADWVLDSAAGPFDRTFGLIYGLGRGLLLVVIAYLFYVWLVPPENREDWVRNARSLAMIESTGMLVTDFLPVDIRDTLRSRIAARTSARQAQARRAGQDEQGYRPPDATCWIG
jgi:membrane protein required for colicin V production